MSRVRIGVIGAGHWGQNHVRTIASLSEAELVSVCDVDPQVRDRIRQHYPGVRVTDVVSKALEGVDAVVVASSAPTHSSIAKHSIERRLPTLVEKPFALSVKEAEEVADLAEATGVPVVVGHLLVFHPAIERLKQMIAAGELGSIYYLYSQRVNLGQVRPDENALWSFGPHDVSVALELLPEQVIRVSAQGNSYLQPGIEDVVFITMQFESGVIAHAQMSWLDPHKERRLTVVGSRKMVVFDDMQPREKLKIYDKGVNRAPAYASYGESLAIREGDILSPVIPNVEPLRAELRHFISVVRGEVVPRTPASSGVAVTRVLAAASESLERQGALVELDATRVAAQ